MGTLLITLAAILRLALFLFTELESRSPGETDGWFKKCCLAVANCIAWVIEKIVQQFTKYGFICSAFTAEGFCSAAWTAACTNLMNLGVFSIVQTTETLISTGGNLVICALNSLLA